MKPVSADKKVRFFPFFPYGICSRYATAIIGRTNYYATRPWLYDKQETLITQAESTRATTMKRAKYLAEKEYVRDTRRACGTPSEERAFRFLTRQGIAAALSTVTDTESPKSEKKNTAHDGNIKDILSEHFTTSEDLEGALHLYALSHAQADRAIFEDLLLESVKQDRISPLSASLHIAHQAKATTSPYSPNQLYNIWRHSHVQAMFLANDHLTYLDRRPYDTGFTIDGIHDDESFLQYTNKHGVTMAAYTYHALNAWYRANPDFYRIKQTLPTPGENARQEWIRTPAFYKNTELPYMQEDESAAKIDTEKQRMNAVHIGLATGKKVNYVCYHAPYGSLKSFARREAESKDAIEGAVRQMKTQSADFTANDKCDFALYFCTTRHQFDGLFKQTIEKHKPGERKKHPMMSPYTSTHVVPVNDSGTFLLWCLLEMSPRETEAMASQIIIKQNPDVTYSPNVQYQATYHGKRVFMGHTMDIARIHHALEDYLDGQRFYISCFPEQVLWYKRLFPENQFL